MRKKIDREQVHRLLDQGMKNIDIAKTTGYGKSTLQRVISQYKRAKGIPLENNGSQDYFRKLRNGQPRKQEPVTDEPQMPYLPGNDPGPLGKTMRQAQVIVDAWEASTSQARDMFMVLVGLKSESKEMMK